MRRLVMLCVVSLLALTVLPTPARGAEATPPASDSMRGAAPVAGWQWPLSPLRLVRAYDPPSHAYGRGHRGVDLQAGVGAVVGAPTAGVIAFAGTVAGRGVVTIDRGDGHVVSLEPVTTSVPAGSSVRLGEEVGTVARGGHAVDGAVHIGIRLDGEYIDPGSVLGRPPRAVLLPCCAATAPGAAAVPRRSPPA